jgi:hypothetical protein
VKKLEFMLVCLWGEIVAKEAKTKEMKIGRNHLVRPIYFSARNHTLGG